MLICKNEKCRANITNRNSQKLKYSISEYCKECYVARFRKTRLKNLKEISDKKIEIVRAKFVIWVKTGVFPTKD